MKPLVLAFGDSLTEGYGFAPSQSFASQIERLLRQRHPDAQVVNAGISGDTTASALARLPRLLSSLRQIPDLVIVELGANDLLRGIPLERTRANLDTILTELKRCNLPILLAQMEAPPFLGMFGQACTAVYADLATRHGVALAPFLPEGVLGNPALTLRDRVHPNAKGTALIASRFLPAVIAALDRATEQAA
jgi:acyl-CoA thioesterase-1